MSRLRHCPDCNEIRLLVQRDDGRMVCADCHVDHRIYQIVERVEKQRRAS